MSKLLLLYVFLMLSSCSRVIERNLKSAIEKDFSFECIGVIELVNENWGKDKKLNYYHSKNDFLNALQRNYQNCLSNMSREDVVKLLGTPTESDHSYLVYYLNEDCFRMTTETTCNALEFYMDSNKVTAFSVRPLPIFVH